MALPRAIRPLLFALLALNAAIYAGAGRFSEGLDALAWFVLLALFAIESRRPPWTQRRTAALLLAGLRLAAATGVALAALAFLREREWLDAINALLWIGVVAVLELEVRLPAALSGHRRAVQALSFALYAALAAVALAWLIRGDWFDAWDALLWIAAFALIEMELLDSAEKSI